MNENFRWKTAVNMSMNRNKVVSLHKDYKSFRYGSEGFSMAYDMWVKKVENWAISMVMDLKEMKMARSK